MSVLDPLALDPEERLGPRAKKIGLVLMTLLILLILLFLDGAADRAFIYVGF
ncbi:MAG: hypothetical protein HY815_04340 [Candidatus Riflebacteria bacterium]|nr:hypothetical protein [Candidatus Riflebacteria bacterium]